MKDDGRSIRMSEDGVRTWSSDALSRPAWRSLDELAHSKSFLELSEREFPSGATEWQEGVSRRNFLKLSAASLALAGLTACTKQPVETIVPYVKQPEEMVLGEPLIYASAFVLGGYATGVLVKNREGHPVKVEGNPQHPASLGSSNVWMQASIRDLYDPDRSHAVARSGEISSWSLFLSELNEILTEQSATKGVGMRFLTETVTSPTLAAQLQQLLEKFPKAKWHQYEPVNLDNVHEGARMAFAQAVIPHYRFDQAAIILSLDSDFLYAHPMRLRYAREFVKGRDVTATSRQMNRLYVAEPTPTLTGSMADNRLAIGFSDIQAIARQLFQQLRETPGEHSRSFSGYSSKWIDAVARELRDHSGSSLVICGEQQPGLVHALTHHINQLLGNVGRTVFYTDPADANPVQQVDSLRELSDDMKAGVVESLFILGGNPVYSAPNDFAFGEHLTRVKRSVHLSQYLDETSAMCRWHIPQAHFMESWGDARAYEGTVSIIQPLIAPLHGGKSVHELLGAMLRQQPIASDYEVVRNYWSEQNLWPDFEKGWRRALHDGFIDRTALPFKSVRFHDNPASYFPSATGRTFPTTDSGLEVQIKPDPHLWDGRFANNGWLQELPKPLDKLCWDNVVRISSVLAQQLRVSNGDVVQLSHDGRVVRGPVWIMPGQAERTVSLELGYGRSRAGQTGSKVGFNAYALRTSKSLWSGTDLQVRPTGDRHQVATTQSQHLMPNPERQVCRGGTFAQYMVNADFVREESELPSKEETLYDPKEFVYKGYRWGMSINLTACIGCNACVLGCQSENNIPVVGKEQIARGRDMLWIRIDTYYKGARNNPGFMHVPVPCMHCEHAPCEVVCPVEATLHDSEGLNLQVYNRCVGTRYCSNNCPYKVRRFNFFHYAKEESRTFGPMLNPEVTVRWRGVMEKCTYCIQRISASRIKAKEENRSIRDGEVLTACQQACPTEAIIFGDLNDRNSRVSKLKNHPLDYSMLGQLNTRPRTTYLAEIENPNPELNT